MFTGTGNSTALVATRAALILTLGTLLGGCQGGGGSDSAASQTFGIGGLLTVEVEGDQGGPFTGGTQNYDITNLSGVALDWEATTSANWLVLSQTSGTIGVGLDDMTTASIDDAVAALLPTGVYTANLEFTQAGTPDGMVTASFTLVIASPLLVTPGTDFGTHCTLDGVLVQDEVTYQLTNLGGTSLDWTATVSDTWMFFVGPSTGTLSAGGTTSVTVRLDGTELAFGLGAGLYTGTADFSTDGDPSVPLALNILASVLDMGERPGPSNTGLYDEMILVPSGSITVSVDGSLIENMDVTGFILVEADNVTIRNCRIDGDALLYGVWIPGGTGGSGTVIEDTEIFNCPAAAVKGFDFTARRLNVHDCEDGFKADDNVTIEATWVHDQSPPPATDGDAVQIRVGSNFVFRGNNFDVPGANNGGNANNSCFGIDASAGPTSNITIDGNWLNGGNFTIYIRDINSTGPPTNAVVTNNRFGREFNFGTLSEDTTDLVIWGNIWDDTGDYMLINEPPPQQ